MASHPLFLAIGPTDQEALAAVGQWPDPLRSNVDGTITFDWTSLTGTPGAATINKIAGKVAIDIGASSVVVTNSLVTTNSFVFAVLQETDATLLYIKSVIPANGSFTITGNAAATAATNVAFLVLN